MMIRKGGIYRNPTTGNVWKVERYSRITGLLILQGVEPYTIGSDVVSLKEIRKYEFIGCPIRVDDQ